MRKKGSALIAAGLLLLAASLALACYNVWDAHRADVAAQAAVKSLKTIIPTETRPDPQPDPEETAPQPETREPTQAAAAVSQEREMPTVELNGYQYIGVLDVESVELSLPVMDRWDYERLKISPCRFTGNVYQDDLVICAHNYAQHFTPLKYVPIGTEVKFTDAEGTVFRYAVSSIDTVGPNDVEGMITGDWDLTLFTCNTNGQTRCAIRCDRIQ